MVAATAKTVVLRCGIDCPKLLAMRKKLPLDDQDDGLPGFDDQDSDSVSPITHPFNPAAIKVSIKQTMVELLAKRWSNNEIDLEPSFQRRARLWSKEQRSRLIESLLLKIPLPVFYVASDEKDNWRVVDGIQRLTTLFDFIVPQPPYAGQGEGVGFALSGLEYLLDLEGKSYAGLPRHLQRRIDETQLTVNVIEYGTPELVMLNIFKRINTGGIMLNSQEIRNALHSGKAREFLQALIAEPVFKDATGSVNDERFGAQELVLRCIAFAHRPWAEYAKADGGLEGYISGMMAELDALSSKKLNSLRRDFCKSMVAATALFGPNAFRKPAPKGAKRNALNRPLFEAWGANLARCNEKQIALLLAQKSLVQKKFRALLKKDEFQQAISYGTGMPAKVQYRLTQIKKLIDEVLHAD